MIPNDKLPCLTCPRGDDVRFALGTGALDDNNNRSPNSGLPIMCCRIRIVGVVPPEMNARWPNTRQDF